MSYIFGVAAVLIGVIGSISYLIGCWKGQVKPHRYAWTIFLIMSVVSFASQAALGAQASLFYFGWQVIANLAVVALSFRKESSYSDLTRTDLACFILALISIIVWKLTDSALLALILVLFAGSLGSTLNVIKAYRHPRSEPLLMWSLGILAAALSALAVGKLDWGQLLAPLQLIIFCSLIVGAILIGRSKEKRPTKR